MPHEVDPNEGPLSALRAEQARNLLRSSLRTSWHVQHVKPTDVLVVDLVEQEQPIPAPSRPLPLWKLALLTALGTLIASMLATGLYLAFFVAE